MKTVLLAVCGLTPQVVTETLYALHQQGMQVDAIRILTTRLGKDVCIGQLLRAEDGEYYRYLDEYGIDRDTIDFGPAQVKAVLYEDGTEIGDIDTEEENERFLRLCMEESFAFTADPDTRVFFSIAGGRRTMGASLSLAAQCYARRQDRIYHVLLSPSAFDGCRDFFYPPKVSRQIEVRTTEGQPCLMETDLAEITLVPMPFFPLRAQLTPQMLAQPQSPAALMLSLVREKKHELSVDLRQQKLTWKQTELDMNAANLALYALFVLAKKDSECNRSSCQECDACYLTFAQISERQERLTSLYKKMTTRELGKNGIVNLCDIDFNPYKSKINRQICQQFGEYDGRLLQIESVGTRPARYGIRLDKNRIKLTR